MFNYDDWCKHYGYEKNSEEAKIDYQKYCEKLNFFRTQTSKKEEDN